MSAPEYALDMPLPQNLEVERSLLGCILMDNTLSSDLAAEDFFLDPHRRIYRAMVAMREEVKPIDIVTLCDELSNRKELAAVGGAAYLSSLTNGTPPRTSLDYYVRVIREKSELRKIIRASNDVMQMALEGATVEDCRAAIQSKIGGESTAPTKRMFVDVNDFCSVENIEPVWLVEGLIEEGSNGFICGDPKASKSVAAIGLAVSLGLGLPWLGLEITRRVRVALVSREDNPKTTQRRLQRFIRGKGADMGELRGWLWVNSKRESPRFTLDNPAELRILIAELKRVKSEFVILDVFNKLHVQDENDATAMKTVIDKLDAIQEETGAQVCIVHHFNRSDNTSLTRRLRGSSAIAGSAEWIVGIELVDEPTDTRRMIFEGKGEKRLQPLFYRITDNPNQSVSLVTVDWNPEAVEHPKRKGKAASGLWGRRQNDE